MNIVIEGDLTREEAFEILTKVRTVEKRRSGRPLSVVISAPNLSHEQIEALMAEIFRGGEFVSVIAKNGQG